MIRCSISTLRYRQWRYLKKWYIASHFGYCIAWCNIRYPKIKYCIAWCDVRYLLWDIDDGDISKKGISLASYLERWVVCCHCYNLVCTQTQMTADLPLLLKCKQQFLKIKSSIGTNLMNSQLERILKIWIITLSACSWL